MCTLLSFLSFSSMISCSLLSISRVFASKRLRRSSAANLCLKSSFSSTRRCCCLLDIFNCCSSSESFLHRLSLSERTRFSSSLSSPFRLSRSVVFVDRAAKSLLLSLRITMTSSIREVSLGFLSPDVRI